VTARELIERLKNVDPDTEVMVLDGSNGGGLPRTLNFGPVSQEIFNAHADMTADCEDHVGEVVLLIGYGCY
jgi:hypothetical protein